MELLVKIAMMAPLKKLREATFFKNAGGDRLEICKEGDEGAMNIPLYQINMNLLNKPKIQEVTFCNLNIFRKIFYRLLIRRSSLL